MIFLAQFRQKVRKKVTTSLRIKRQFHLITCQAFAQPERNLNIVVNFFFFGSFKTRRLRRRIYLTSYHFMLLSDFDIRMYKILQLNFCVVGVKDNKITKDKVWDFFLLANYRLVTAKHRKYLC